MATGRFEEAIPIYKQLVRSVPGNPGLLLNLALAEHMAGHDREAVPNLEAVLKAEPNSLPALISLAAARLALNQPEEAAKHYRKLCEIAADNPAVWYGLGMSYQSIAVSAFERLQRIDTKSPYVSALVADTRVQRRQYRSAFFFYSEAIKQLPALHGMHAALADVYRKSGHADWAAGEDAKERALPPANCAAHAAECQFMGGHDLQAIGAASTPESLYWKTKAANELATQAFFRLGQLPPSVELHQFKAEVARNQGQPLEAVKEWQAALALAPGDLRLRQELALTLLTAQNYQAAFDEATGLQSAEMKFVAGESLLRLEKPDEAVPYLESALVADPKLLPAHASLGLALSRQGKHALAIPHLEKALELDDDGSLHYQLARAYQSAGNAEQARRAMTKYQEIVKRNEEQKAEVAKQSQITR